MFHLQINGKVFFKLIISLREGMPKLPEINLRIFLQYLKENMKGEVDFLPADKHQRFLQNDTIILDVCGQACRNYLK